MLAVASTPKEHEMIRLIVVATAALLAVPTLALAADPSGPDRENAARYCKTQRAAMGTAAFNEFYAPNGPASSAYGRCVSRTARAQVTHRTNAAKQCRAEQNDPNFAAEHEGKSFTQFYGPGRNAFGKCVSQKAKAAANEQLVATVLGVASCRTERASNPTAFRNKYGTGPQKANAFGRCVARKLPTP